jgi:hypothetical protein
MLPRMVGGGRGSKGIGVELAEAEVVLLGTEDDGGIVAGGMERGGRSPA